MTLNIIELPDSIGAGAQITFADGTTTSVSEGGNANRKLLRGIKRQYTCSIRPEDAMEMQKIIMAIRGKRYPLALKDPWGYQFDEDLLDIDADGNALLGRRWIPATGDLDYFQRIMIPDGALTFELNGVPATPTVDDYGVCTFGSPLVSGSDQPRVMTGDYLTAVCLLDNASATAITTLSGELISQFSDLRFEELFEAELRALTA
jgi:hypothetical protein